MKWKALNDSCENPCQIPYQEFGELGGNTFTLTNWPTNLEALHLALISLDETQTNRDENYLSIILYNNEQISVAFSTTTNLKFLSECKVLNVDGTFKNCPKLLGYQLFIIHSV